MHLFHSFLHKNEKKMILLIAFKLNFDPKIFEGSHIITTTDFPFNLENKFYITCLIG